MGWCSQLATILIWYWSDIKSSFRKPHWKIERGVLPDIFRCPWSVPKVVFHIKALTFSCFSWGTIPNWWSNISVCSHSFFIIDIYSFSLQSSYSLIMILFYLLSETDFCQTPLLSGNIDEYSLQYSYFFWV